MKIFISFLVSILIAQISYSQNFNTIQHNKKYHKIGLVKAFEPVEEQLENEVIDKEDVAESETEFTKEDIINSLSAKLPLMNMSLTSRFGYRTHPVTKKTNIFHSGIDLAGRSDSVYSILHGTVIASGYSRLLGNYVRIKHGNYESVVGHLSTRFVLKGDPVSAGFPIGITGTTGRVTGEHLHFTIKYKGKYINPLPFLARIISLTGQPLLAAIGHNDETDSSNQL